MLLDLEMPVMDGWEVVASLRRAEALETLRVVVVSAAEPPPPGVAFVRKPCRIDDLLAVIGDRRAEAAEPSPRRGHHDSPR